MVLVSPTGERWGLEALPQSHQTHRWRILGAVRCCKIGKFSAPAEKPPVSSPVWGRESSGWLLGNITIPEGLRKVSDLSPMSYERDTPDAEPEQIAKRR